MRAGWDAVSEDAQSQVTLGVESLASTGTASSLPSATAIAAMEEEDEEEVKRALGSLREDKKVGGGGERSWVVGSRPSQWRLCFVVVMLLLLLLVLSLLLFVLLSIVTKPPDTQKRARGVRGIYARSTEEKAGRATREGGDEQ